MSIIVHNINNNHEKNNLADCGNRVPYGAGACVCCEWANGAGVQGSRVIAGGSQHGVARGQAPWPAGQVSFRLGAHHLPGSHHLRSIGGRCGPPGQRISPLCVPSVEVSLALVCALYDASVSCHCLHLLCASPFLCVCSVCLLHVSPLCVSCASFCVYLLCVFLYVYLLCNPPLCSSSVHVLCASLLYVCFCSYNLATC